MQAESTQAAAGYGQVRLVWPYRIQQISELRLERNVGEHARLWLTGIVPEEDKDRYIQEARSQDPIALEETDEQGKTKRTLFQGILDTIAVRVVRGIYYVELTAVSCSALMDVQARTRSYQNREMKCSELVESVLAAYPGSDFIDNAMSHQRIGQFTLQYKETDWQFLKRVASRFGAVVIVESAAASPKLWMGLPLGRLHPLPEDTPYTIQRDLSALEEARGDGAADLHPYDFTRYAVDLVNWYPLGDILAFAGQELLIFSAVTRFTGGELRHQYILSPERGIRQNKILNTPLAGASLEGKIIDVQKDQVRVHMDVDGKQAKEEASWLPYSSIYTAEGNSGFYCMPQQGDSVQVYFPSPREEEAIAMSSIRRGGQPSPKMEDPRVKYWGTNYGKEMKFGGSELTLTATEGSLFISLEDEAGVLIQSDSGIIMASKKDLELASEKEIKIEAETAIYLVCGDSSIVMDGDTDIQGTEIVLEGLQKCPVYVEDLEPEPEAPFVSEVEPPEKKKSFWEKALDVVQVGLDVAGLIPGLGEIADLVNAGIYLARGDYANAALSAAAAIPFAGWAATGAKFVKRGVEAFKTGQKLMKGVDRAVDAFQAVKKTASMMPSPMRQDLGKVWTSARKLGNNLGLGEQLGKIKNAMQRLSVSHPRLAHAVSTSASVSQQVAMQYTRSLAIEAAMEAGGRIEFIGDFIEQIGGDKMRAAITWVSIATNKGRSKGTGLNRNLGFTGGGGNGGSGKRGGKDDTPPAFKQTKFASSYESRINQTPAPGNPKVGFEGQRGESKCILKPPPDPDLKKILDEAGIDGINYKNAVPDFSPVSKAQLEIDHMVGGTGSNGTKARAANFKQADIKLAEQLNNSPELANQFGLTPGKIKAGDIADVREEFKLTWHELNDGRTIQLVPSEINSKFGHLGGVGEINAGAFEPGGFANN